jgi:hypothetical protein
MKRKKDFVKKIFNFGRSYLEEQPRFPIFAVRSLLEDLEPLSRTPSFQPVSELAKQNHCIEKFLSI